MGGQTSVQIVQWKGREYPNEESITCLEFFPLTAKLSDVELKNMIRRDYGYCVCRQIIYSKESPLIQAKYFPDRELEKMNWLYVGILRDTNCRCAYYELIKMNELFVKEIQLLHTENKELKKLVEKSNSEISKLKSNISSLETKLSNLDKKVTNQNLQNQKK